jgi:signal transduction histidine kinase/GAF domain-containing protein
MEAKTQPPVGKESTIVERVARIVSSVRGSRPDYTFLAAELEPAIPFDVFGVVLLRHDQQGVRVTVCERTPDGWSARYHQHPFQDSQAQQLKESPATIIRNFPTGLDGLPAQCGDALSGCHDVRSTFIAPLMAETRFLGTLELGSRTMGTYDDPALQRLIHAVVQVLANAIDGAQVGGSVAIQDRQRKALQNVTNALTAQVDLASVLEQIVAGIAQSLNVASAIVVFDQRTGAMRLETQCGLDEAKLRTIIEKTEAANSRSILSAARARRQSCTSDDIGTDSRFPASRAFANELGLRSVCSYPLITGARVYGALLLCSTEAGGFTPLKTDILSLFASQATIAIHNRMLTESVRQRSRFHKALEQLQQIHAADDAQALFLRLQEETKRSFGVSLSSLLYFMSEHLLTRDERELQALFHPAPAEYPPLADTAGWPQEAMSGFSADALFLSIANGHDPFTAHASADAFLAQSAEDERERVQLLAELSRFLVQLKQTPGHGNDAVVVTDLHGLCIFLNSGAEILCGKQRNAASGRPLSDVLARLLPRIRNRDEIRQYLQEFQQEQFFRQEVRCVLAEKPVRQSQEADQQKEAIDRVLSLMGNKTSGQKAARRTDQTASDQYFQLSRYPLVNAQETPAAFVLQIHDVTEQVRDEKNRSALLSTVSHELRTPLTTIKIAVTGLLQQDMERDETTLRELLEDVNAEADRLSMLVNSLVEMSRIEMGALILEKSWCDVVEILDGAFMRQECVTTEHSVITHLQDDLPLIFADHAQLEKVFLHLIENAAQRSPAGGEIEIAIEAYTDAASLASFTRVSISDQGPPILPDEQDRLFKTFYGRNGHGLGLSLAICRGIIEAHHGKISVEESLQSRKTVFTFVIPVHAQDTTSSVSQGEETNYATEERL